MTYQVKAYWVKQTKRFQRFEISGELAGTVYVPNDKLPTPLSQEFPKVIDVEVRIGGQP